MQRYQLRRRVAVLVAAVVACAGFVFTANPTAAEGISLPTPTSQVPTAGTPFVDDGRVTAFQQIGSTMVAGGTFTSVAGLPKRAVLAMTAPAYALSTTFNPVLDGDVTALLAGPTAGTVFVAGSFATVNGEKSKSLALLDVATGARVASFKVPFINGIVNSVERLGNQLVIGGTFTKVGGQARGGLASLNIATGAVTTLLTNSVSVNHNWNGSGAKAAVGVTDLVVTPDNSKLVAIGNFKKVDGLDRDQIVMLDVTGSSAVVKADWRANGYTARCYSWAFDSYVRDVDVSADGSFFAVAATGGSHDGLCDSVARFDTATTGSDVKPSWVNYTGGDTLLSVAITGSVVYTGGHARWSNNPLGNDFAGAGAVPRPGLQAVDARNGIPVSWNPGRNPRGDGAYAVYATSEGLWVGSDTEWVGDFMYRRGRIAMFPLAGGQQLASEATAELPGAIYRGGGSSAAYTSTSFDGTSAGSPAALSDPGLAFSGVRGSTMIGDRLFYGRSDGTFAYRTVAPGGVLGPEVAIDPYNDPTWSDVDSGSGQTYRGKKPDFYSEIPSISAMWYDAGTLYYTTGGTTVYARSFSPDSGVIHPQKSTVSSPLPSISDAFVTGGVLYYVAASNGALWKVGFSGGQFTGSPTQVTGPGVTGVDWRAPLLYLASAANVLPVAAASGSCADLTCTFSSAGSADPDGTLTAYSWNFGDGTPAATQAGPSHAYAAPGTYSVTLTVTDNRGGTASKTISIDATAPQSPVSFVGATSVNTAAKAPTVGLPAGLAAGDRLLLVATTNTASTATAPTGWVQLHQVASAGMLTTVWQRAATASDHAGDQVAVTYDVWTKSDVKLLAYRGAGEASTVAAKVVGAATNHVAPSVTVTGARSWLFTYWAVKGTDLTALTPDAKVTGRSLDIAAASPGISALAGDSNGAFVTGATGTRTATTDVAGARDVGLSIVLPPAT